MGGGEAGRALTRLHGAMLMVRSALPTAPFAAGCNSRVTHKPVNMTKFFEAAGFPPLARTTTFSTIRPSAVRCRLTPAQWIRPDGACNLARRSAVPHLGAIDFSSRAVLHQEISWIGVLH
jgi:hypothetical protein